MKNMLTGLMLLMNTTFIYSQTLVPFPPAGLVQGEIRHGDWTAPGQFDATITRIADTVIAGMTYNRFKSDQPINNFYTRYDSGKVYFVYSNWDGSIGSEYELYDFTLTPGETFVSSQLANPAVDSVSTITLLNGEVRKYMRLNGVMGTYTWVDGIGDIERGFKYYSDFEGGHVDFVCHTDATGLIWLNNAVSYDCDSLTQYTTVGIPESQRSSFAVYPNPVNDLFYLKGDFHGKAVVEITVMDLSGRIVISRNNCSVFDGVDASDLVPGVYTLTVFDGSAFYTSRLIKD